MTVDQKLQAEVHRLFYAEHFTMNAIAESLKIHHDTVKNILDTKKFSSQAMPRISMLDPYVHVIEEALTKYPRICAPRILQMLKDRGYIGCVTTVRDKLRVLRPRAMKAYLPLIFLPGEQAQVDWAHFGQIAAENTQRKLSCFVMVLSHSRAMYARFTYDQTMESFLRCHILAFAGLGGVARSIAYDNLRSVVIAREGRSIDFHPHHTNFSGHYHFRTVACNVRAGWEKGRVERSIRYIRDNFFSGRTFRDLGDANEQLKAWLGEYANQRSWPDDRSKRVFDEWQKEKSLLLPLPEHEFDVDLLHPVRSGKLPYIRFDLNDYSIPFELVGKPLSLVASDLTVKIFDDQTLVCSHRRTYGKGLKIRHDQHFDELWQRKGRAHRQDRQAAIISAIPAAQDFFLALSAQGMPLGASTKKLSRLMTEYGTEAVALAISEALTRNCARINILSQILYENLAKACETQLVPLEFSSRKNLNNITVTPHNLANYDQLTSRHPEEQT